MVSYETIVGKKRPVTEQSHWPNYLLMASSEVTQNLFGKFYAAADKLLTYNVKLEILIVQKMSIDFIYFC